MMQSQEFGCGPLAFQDSDEMDRECGVIWMRGAGAAALRSTPFSSDANAQTLTVAPPLVASMAGKTKRSAIDTRW